MNIFQKIFHRSLPLRLVQLGEHLTNLESGVKPFEPGYSLKEACLKAAKDIWPHTGLSEWASRSRESQHCYVYGNGSLGFMAINADHQNCFLIIIFETKTSQPFGYLLFDIGAEYNEPIYFCPAINYKGPPTTEMIENSIPKLTTVDDAFAVMDIGNGTYMQALQIAENSFRLEHQLVNTANHYEAEGELSAQQVISALKSYAFGKKEWATEIAWRKLDL